jgi:hypothetical protein
MKSIPKKATPVREKTQIPQRTAADLRPVTTERQSVLVAGAERLPDVVVPLPQLLLVDCLIPQPRRKLANVQISCCNIPYNRI